MGAIRIVEGVSDRDVAAARAVGGLTAVEPDLGDPAVAPHGRADRRALAIEPEPRRGVAVRFLLELRFEHGPLPTGGAADRLQRWWRSREG
ncbi:MAG: hypothetical protein R2695_06545 [Acidimicrobiales bacterium]